MKIKIIAAPKPMSLTSVLIGVAVSLTTAATAQPMPQFTYTTLDYGINGTFLTGIRGNNIVGNYVIPNGSGGTGGLLYNQLTNAWSLFPTPTANGSSYPGATGSSPYGPSFGSQFGILKAVGSFKTATSSPYDMSYLYNAAGGPSGTLTTLTYPATPAAPVLNTIAHSTFGDQVVGNYDTKLTTGNAFIYTISTGTYSTNNFPGALSTTAYGVWGDKIAGGYTPPGLGFERGYIFNQTTGTWQTYNHPGAVFTHFEGITGAGRGGEYNLVADWAGVDGVLHAAVLHIGNGGIETWIDYGVTGALTSANSIYENQAIGIYVDSSGITHGYSVKVPGIYNPISNTGPLNSSTSNAPALAGGIGDDVLNTGVIVTSAANNSGIRSDSYSVVSNYGSISVTGNGSAGIELNGAYGTLLNAGAIIASPGSDAIRTGPVAAGTTIVNNGIIDGRVAVNAGPMARFENSGWLGISAPGAGTTHVISGTFVQTSSGTFVVRIAGSGNDSLLVGGTALLAGTLAPQIAGTAGVPPFAPPIGQQYQVLSAVNGVSGAFSTVTQPAGLSPGTRFDTLYATTAVDLVVTPSSYAGLASGSWYSAVGAALDTARPAAGSPMTTTQSAIYTPLYSLSAAQVATTLQQLAPVIYSDTLMLNRGSFQMVGDAISRELQARRGAPSPVGSNRSPGPYDTTIWVSGSGQFINLHNASNGTPGYSGSSGGVVAGIDVAPLPEARLGLAIGFNSQSISTSTAADYSGHSLQVQAYGSANHGILFVDAQAGGVFNEGTAHRTLSAHGVTANGDVDGNGFGGSLRGGARLGIEKWNIEPSLTLSGLSLHQNGLTETGAGPVGVNVGGSSITSIQTLVSMQVDRRFPINGVYAIVPSMQAGWAYETMNTQARTSASFIGAPGSAFTMSNPSIGRSAAVVGVHAILETGAPIEVFAGYDAAFNNRSTAQTVTAGVRYFW
jgi:subtilase-type serine protease